MTWTVNRRIVGAFLSTILLLVIIVIVGWLGLNDAVRAYDVAVEDEERTAIAYRAEGEFHDARQAFLHYLITPTAEWRTRTDSAFTISNEHLRQLANNSPEGNLRSTFEQALALQGEWLTEARAAMDLVDRGDLQSAVRYQDQRSLPLAQRFVATLQRGAQIQTAQTDSVRALATETAARNRGLLLLLGGLCVIVGLVSAFILSRAVMNPLRRTIAALASSASEILAATTQQAAGTTETMAAVTETAATVDEVAQTSEQASERAQSVSTAAQRAATISRTGREAVDHSIGAMADITQQVETIVGQLRELATQAQAIGDIIVAVDDISDLTNLLALNAAIEAARAGEEGRGFAVVASEIRGLADQSKKATVQVRQILGEIQRASNAAVAAGEQGSRQVTAGAAQIREAGETIRALSEAVAESAQAAVQIAASAGQQSMGMGQIRQAMSSIETVAQQNLAATQQTERAAQDLEAVGQQLLAMVGADGNAVR